MSSISCHSGYFRGELVCHQTGDGLSYNRDTANLIVISHCAREQSSNRRPVVAMMLINEFIRIANKARNYLKHQSFTGGRSGTVS